MLQHKKSIGSDAREGHLEDRILAKRKKEERILLSMVVVFLFAERDRIRLSAAPPNTLDLDCSYAGPCYRQNRYTKLVKSIAWMIIRFNISAPTMNVFATIMFTFRPSPSRPNLLARVDQSAWKQKWKKVCQHDNPSSMVIVQMCSSNNLASIPSTPHILHFAI